MMEKFCRTCYPNYCTCPRSTQDRIEALELALTETWWNERERAEIEQELKEVKDGM